MAITRLVNGVADAGQNRRLAASVADIAAAAGVPRAAVDARHEATHNELPSEDALSAAAAECEAWLRESYWNAQTATLEGKRAAAAALVAEHVAMRVDAAVGSSGQIAAAAAAADQADPDGDSLSKPARKRRRALVGELSDAVPPRAVAVLADVLVPAGGRPSPLPPPGDAAAVSAWRDTLSALDRGWPGVVAAAACRAADGLARESDTAGCAAWLAALAAHGGGGSEGVAEAAAGALPAITSAAAAASAAGLPHAAAMAAGSAALADLSGRAGAVERVKALVGGGGGGGGAAPDDDASLEAATAALLQAAASKKKAELSTDAPWALVEEWQPCPLGALPRRGCVAGREARF